MEGIDMQEETKNLQPLYSSNNQILKSTNSQNDYDEFVAINEFENNDSFNDIYEKKLSFAEPPSQEDSELQPDKPKILEQDQVTNLNAKTGEKIEAAKEVTQPIETTVGKSEFYQKNSLIIKNIDIILASIKNLQDYEYITKLCKNLPLNLLGKFTQRPELNYVFAQTAKAEFVFSDPTVTWWFLSLTSEQREVFDIICQYDKQNSTNDVNKSKNYFNILKNQPEIRKMLNDCSFDACQILIRDHNLCIATMLDPAKFDDFQKALKVSKNLDLNDDSTKKLIKHTDSLIFIRNKLSLKQQNKIKQNGLANYIKNTKSKRYCENIGIVTSLAMLAGSIFVTLPVQPLHQKIVIATCAIICLTTLYASLQSNRIIKKLTKITDTTQQTKEVQKQR